MKPAATNPPPPATRTPALVIANGQPIEIQLPCSIEAFLVALRIPSSPASRGRPAGDRKDRRWGLILLSAEEPVGCEDILARHGSADSAAPSSIPTLDPASRRYCSIYSSGVRRFASRASSQRLSGCLRICLHVVVQIISQKTANHPYSIEYKLVPENPIPSGPRQAVPTVHPVVDRARILLPQCPGHVTSDANLRSFIE